MNVAVALHESFEGHGQEVRTDADGWFEFARCGDRPHELRVFEAQETRRTTLARLSDVEPGPGALVIRVGQQQHARITGLLADAQSNAADWLPQR